MVEFEPGALARVRELAAGAYPHEGCGVLIGRPGAGGGDGATVVEVTSGRNLRTDRARDRYELDPADIVRAERRAREQGLEITGFWHSHPDHPARPSAFDTERAWLDYVYVVVNTSVQGSGEVRAWRLDESTSSFAEIDLVERAAGATAEGR